MNWRKIAIYAAALFIVQFAIGFLEGFLASGGTASLLASSLASFLMCAGIFAHFAAHQPSKPFTHGLVALVLQAIAGMALFLAMAHWLGGTAGGSLSIEWFVLVCALMVGTVLGSVFGRRTDHPAGA